MRSVANSGRNHIVGEEINKPSISACFILILLKDVMAMPLSNNSVSKREDEMGEDIETQPVEELKSRKFSVQMDESTVRDSEY